MSEPTGHDESREDRAAGSDGSSDDGSGADPRKDPAPNDPAPNDPAPNDPAPNDPAPNDPAPSGDAAHALTHEPTGDAEIDAALATLAGLDSVPVHDHAPVVERVHRVLQDRLADGQE